jgi:hypothetical protein
MRKLILLFLIVLGFKCQAQYYFNSRIDLHQSWCDYGWSIYSDSLNIHVLAATCYGSGISGLVVSTLLKFDYDGLLLDSNSYSLPNRFLFPGGPGSFSKTSEGFLFGGSVEDSLQTDAALIKLNDNFNLTWLSSFGDNDYQSCWQAKEISDGGFAFCGQTATSDTFGNMWLVKTDSIGDVVWSREYGDYQTGFELAFAFIRTSDGGYALTGEKRYNNLPADIFIVKTDSNGIMEWDTTYGDNHFQRAWSIISTFDGNMVIAGFYSCCPGDPGRPYVAKFDLAGNLLWEKKFGIDMTTTGFYSIRELSDGSLIAAGMYTPLSNKSLGLLVKMTANGDSLWWKTYYSGFNSSNELHDVYPTSDGGFAACGVIFPQLPDTGHQDLWVLKVDSLGCEVSNCTVDVNEILHKPQLKIYPNPFTEFVSIEFINPVNHFAIEIFDVTGRKIKTVQGKNENILSVDLKNLNEGIYLINVFSEEEKIYSGKLLRINE